MTCRRSGPESEALSALEWKELVRFVNTLIYPRKSGLGDLPESLGTEDPIDTRQFIRRSFVVRAVTTTSSQRTS